MRFLRSGPALLAFGGAAAVVAACSFDFDSLDPRQTPSQQSVGGGGSQGGAPGSTTSSSTASSSAAGGGGVGGAGGMSSRTVVFTDDFERPDDEDIGNGWVEKTPSAFELKSGEAAKRSTFGEAYRDYIVYRPASESLLDVEVAVEVSFTGQTAGGPNLFVRAQSPGLELPNRYDAYLVYIDDSGTAFIIRQEGSTFGVTLGTFAVAGFTTTARYRMTLRAAGTQPVVLTASVERQDGDGWEDVGGQTVSDSDAKALVTAGTHGFTASSSGPQLRYDNFSVVQL